MHYRIASIIFFANLALCYGFQPSVLFSGKAKENGFRLRPAGINVNMAATVKVEVQGVKTFVCEK